MNVDNTEEIRCMKFKTEVEFCEHVTKILLGLLVGTGRKTISVPEVPRGYFSNEQIDMLLLDMKNQEYLIIEYKLNDLQKLKRQIQLLGCTVGIINTDTNELPHNIFGYTGKDSQIEKMDRFLLGYKYRWQSIYSGFGMIYYWAYKNNKDGFRGGIQGGNRVGFAAVYIKAIRNLHKEYGKLDFMITHAVLQSGYSVATSKKYYYKAVNVQPKPLGTC